MARPAAGQGEGDLPHGPALRAELQGARALADDFAGRCPALAEDADEQEAGDEAADMGPPGDAAGPGRADAGIRETAQEAGSRTSRRRRSAPAA